MAQPKFNLDGSGGRCCRKSVPCPTHAAPVAVPAEPRQVKLVCGNGHEINAKHIAEFARACTPKEVNTLAQSGNNVYLARELLATRKRLAEVTDAAPLPPPQEPTCPDCDGTGNLYRNDVDGDFLPCATCN